MNRQRALQALNLTDSAHLPLEVERAYELRVTALGAEMLQAADEERRRECEANLATARAAFEFLRSASHAGLPDDGEATFNRPVSLTAEAHGLVIGSLVAGRHRVQGVLGSGGMGIVYAAYDQVREEEIAIKVLHGALLLSDAARDRFLSEAKLSSRLSHPNIVRVYDVGTWEGTYYFTMERLRGCSLRQRLRQQP